MIATLKPQQFSLIDLFAWTSIWALVIAAGAMNWMPLLVVVTLSWPFVCGTLLLCKADLRLIQTVTNRGLLLLVTIVLYIAVYDLSVAALLSAYFVSAHLFVVQALRSRLSNEC